MKKISKARRFGKKGWPLACAARAESGSAARTAKASCSRNVPSAESIIWAGHGRKQLACAQQQASNQAPVSRRGFSFSRWFEKYYALPAAFGS